MFKSISDALDDLAKVIHESNMFRKIEFEWFKSHCGFVTNQDLKELEARLMSAISEFAAKQNEYNDRIDAAVTGLQGDIKSLNDLIAQLQNSAGTISPEDQASLDALEARGAAIADKLEALDAETPPVPPVE